ncbi:conserved membrane protein of unknown function [Tenacibaculum sp. 190130A14a]|uniref:Uncharacterized protein n=1 Tax=Tenacibaculum polynesiense TaxID=3137857 RepID=A0ABP1F4G3_9FLAO
MQIIDLLESYGIKIGLLITGTLSGLIGTKIQEKTGFFNYMFGAFCGASCSTYLTPMLVDYLNLSQSSSYGVGFLIGLVSMNLASRFIEISKDLQFIKRLLTKQ